jgi:class 3 adenylate cyclase
VNLASRIEAFSLRGQVLVSQSTYELCQDFADCGPPVQVYMKGKAESVLIREVKGIALARQVRAAQGAAPVRARSRCCCRSPTRS